MTLFTLLVGLFSFNTTNALAGECITNPEITVFMYHYIRDDVSTDTQITKNLSISPEIFRIQMDTVRRIVDAHPEVSLMKGEDFLWSFTHNCFGAKNVWIFSSDDGWIDTATDLVPIAREYGIPFFLGIIGNRIDKKGFMSAKQIVEISNDPLFTISSHSMTHNNQSKMSASAERIEICESKKVLERLINKPVLTFIYPTGRINTTWSAKHLKECGYTLAWSTSLGSDWNKSRKNPYTINRIRVGRNHGEGFFRQFIKSTAPAIKKS